MSGFCTAAVLRMVSCKSKSTESYSPRIHTQLPNNPSFGSANIASAALSPIFAILLRRYGQRTTLLGWTVFTGVVLTAGILCVRSRPTHSVNVEAERLKAKSSLRPFKSPILWLFVLSMALQSLANNLPANYLPSYASDLGVASDKGALLVTYLSLSGIVGQVSLGALT
jgi:cyanate permease